MVTSPLLSNVQRTSQSSGTAIKPSACWAHSYLPEFLDYLFIREMGTVHWIGPQIQCSIQIHCFKIHSVRYELCFKKYLTA